mgnify:FL=1|tara:strand:- start:1727 stop:1879 length:153 start_codon:yes stop_codon:yes gene_type:complete
MIELLNDILSFVKERKKYWLAPVITILLILGVILIYAAGSALAPYIYTLF